MTTFNFHFVAMNQENTGNPNRPFQFTFMCEMTWGGETFFGTFGECFGRMREVCPPNTTFVEVCTGRNVTFTAVPSRTRFVEDPECPMFFNEVEVS